MQWHPTEYKEFQCGLKKVPRFNVMCTEPLLYSPAAIRTVHLPPVGMQDEDNEWHVSMSVCLNRTSASEVRIALRVKEGRDTDRPLLCSELNLVVVICGHIRKYKSAWGREAKEAFPEGNHT